MNNEEKAKEIAHEYFRRGQLGLAPIDTESAGYDCAMQAMKWKDEQFSLERKQLIEKANQAVTQSFENGQNSRNRR